jgi:hypothetical protein
MEAEVSETPPVQKSGPFDVWLITAGILVAVFAISGLLMIPNGPDQVSTLPEVVATLDIFIVTATPLSEAQIQRLPLAETTLRPSETPIPTPTSVPATAPIIEWSDADKNVLSWLCFYEVGGMGNVKIDACLSVISTVRARYAYPNSPFKERDIISTLERPGQFTGVKWDVNRPAPDPDLLWTVNQYQVGMRGSCNGYFYFDSVPGGPSLCIIRSSNGQFMEFHSGWN